MKARFDPTIWTMRDGSTIPINEMETQHIVNTINMLKRNFAPFDITTIDETSQSFSLMNNEGLGKTHNEIVLEQARLSYRELKTELEKRK